MKYKNITNKTIFFKIGGRWIDVLPDATIELRRGAEEGRKDIIPVTEERTEIVEEAKQKYSFEDLDKMKKKDLLKIAKETNILTPKLITKHKLIKLILEE